MATFGYFLSSEEHGPRALVEQAQMAERAGFEKLSISDHFHPWMDEQGESPFVWSTIGGIAATTGLEVTTAVTCPMLRIHPAIIAQAAATCSAMLEGRFRLGVGTGERLNEHVLGQHWPPLSIRQDMLEEAIELMRDLWRGKDITRHGAHYTVENARIYTTPPDEIPVIVSAFGPESGALAARIGDGFMSTAPDAELVGAYEREGRHGPEDRHRQGVLGPRRGEGQGHRPPALGFQRHPWRVGAGAVDAGALRAGRGAGDPGPAGREDPLRT